MFLFNNAHNRDHVKHYGAGAFYDVDPREVEAYRLRPGDTCIVTSYRDSERDLVLDWYTLADERPMIDENGERVRVLFGRLQRSESLQKARKRLPAEP